MVEGFGTALATGMALLIAGMCMSVPALVIINAWLVNKTLDTGMAAIMLSSLVGMIVIMIICLKTCPIVSVGLILLTLAACALSPVLAGRWEKAGLVRLDQEDINKYLLALEHDPKNAAARSMLAQVYLKQCRYDEAIETFEKAIEAYPKSEKDRRLLNRAIKAKQQAEAEGPVCPACGAINPPGAEHCGGCEHSFKQEGFVHFVTQPENLKSIATTAAVTCFFVTIILLFMTMLKPPVAFGLVLMCLTGAAVYLWWKL